MSQRSNHETRFRRGMVALACALATAGTMLVAAPARAQDTDSLSLHQAVTLALQNSRDVKLAQVQYNVALGEVHVAKAEFLPNLYTGSGLAYTHGFPALPGGQPPSIFELQYTEAFFNPLLKGQQHAAEDRAKSQKLELDRVKDDVTVRTASTYLELAKVRHSLELLRAEQVSGEKILQAIRDRVAANQELPIEITRTQLSAARVAESIVKLEDRGDYLESQLRDLTGVPEGQSLQVEPPDDSFTEKLATAQSESDIEEMAIQNDQSLAEAENERAAREHIFKGEKGSYWPTVDIVGQYSILSKFNNYLEFYKQFERNNINVGVQIQIPVFSAKTHANVALAKSQLSEAEVMLSNKRQQVRFDVQQKARSVREWDASREVARLDLQLAQETLQDEQAKFDQNRITVQEMEQARLDENSKWVAFLDADFARQQAQLTLLQATGQLAKVFQ
ncbi:MAG TPA: TolC family protein [Candidatus Acidoferrales bacterium]|nr:TolC family protein [Candidatus Acidoferrales bacterium]